MCVQINTKIKILQQQWLTTKRSPVVSFRYNWQWQQKQNQKYIVESDIKLYYRFKRFINIINYETEIFWWFVDTFPRELLFFFFGIWRAIEKWIKETNQNRMSSFIRVEVMISRIEHFKFKWRRSEHTTIKKQCKYHNHSYLNISHRLE